MRGITLVGTYDEGVSDPRREGRLTAVGDGGAGGDRLPVEVIAGEVDGVGERTGDMIPS